MKKIRFLLAVWVCKILILIGKLMGKKGSATPGVYAYKICPDVLKVLSKKVDKGIIAVCGTNGKTTTNNIIDKVLTDKGYKVVCNNIGANMLSGVVTAFIEKTDIFGKLNCDYATLEMDEAFSVKIFEHLTPSVMVITNLFRDQLDRYGEVELTAGYLKKALALTNGKTKLIINANDPTLVKIGLDYGNFLTYGINEKVADDNGECEIQFCPQCGESLDYNYYHYSQLGDYYCKSCGFKKPEIDFCATDVKMENGLEFTCSGDIGISVDYRGFYNVFNILAALLTIKTIDVDLSDINSILSDYKPQIGRMEKFDLKKPAILNLAKNPAGFNQAIKTVLYDKRKKDIIIAVNDCESDGRDISWLWDVDFESLKDESIGAIGLFGLRKDELDLRLKYAEISKDIKVYDNLKDAVLEKIESDGEVLYVLVNYTVIFEGQKILKELEGNK